MRRFNKNKQSKRRFKKRQGNGRRFGSKQLTARISGFDLPFLAGQNANSPGLLVTEDAVPSDTAGSYSIISPKNLGTRLQTFAECYNEWRMNSLTFKYRPSNFNAASSQTTNFAFSRADQIVAGFVLDPCRGVLSTDELIMSSGRSFSNDRPAQFTVRGSKWLFVDPVGNSEADIRFYSPGSFYAMAFASAGSGGLITYGNWECHWDISFRYPKDPTSDDFKVNQMEVFKNSVSVNKEHFESKRRSREKNPEDGPNGLVGSLATIGISDEFDAKSNPLNLSANGDSPIIIPSISLQQHFGVVQKPPSLTPRPKLQIDMGKVKHK